MSAAEASLGVGALVLLLQIIRFFDTFSSKKETKTSLDEHRADTIERFTTIDKTLTTLTGDVKTVLEEVRKTNGRVIAVETWRVSHEKRTDAIEKDTSDLDKAVAALSARQTKAARRTVPDACPVKRRR